MDFQTKFWQTGMIECGVKYTLSSTDNNMTTDSILNIHEVLLENYLKNHKEPEEIEYYLCGPPMMTQAVLSMLDSLGVPKENILFDDFGA